MQVADSVKQDYKDNSITKYLILEFPGLNMLIDMEQIHGESMTLRESLLESNSIEFVGCISSQFKINVQGVFENIKGQPIRASVYTDGTDPIPLFYGIVDSAKKTSNKGIKEIIAYDELYTKGNIDVASWYDNLNFPLTLKQIRDSLFNYIGIEQVVTDLPNDNIIIQRQYKPKQLQALAVIKAICQINGAFGIINRENKFDYKILAEVSPMGQSYPSEHTYPSMTLYPMSGIGLFSLNNPNENEPEPLSFYKTIKYEDFSVKPVDRLVIRKDEDDYGVSYGSGENKYIIQGNIFAYGLDEATLSTVAQNIYKNIQGIEYVPYSADNNGLPFIECGESVNYKVLSDSNFTTYSVNELTYEDRNFYVMNRELKGIQALKDNYGARGEEYQNEFVTDLSTRLDYLTNEKDRQDDFNSYLDDYFKDIDIDSPVNEYFDDFVEEKFESERDNYLKAVLVKTVPTGNTWQHNTIYFIEE